MPATAVPSPAGAGALAGTYAFFDVDDTLIDVKSMFDFFRYYCLEECAAPQTLAAFDRCFADLRGRGVDRAALNRAYYAFFRGWRRAEIDAAGRRWWQRLLHDRPDVVKQAVAGRLADHRAAGCEPVLVSGSCRSLLAPVAETLGGAHILAAPLIEDANGRFTGALGRPQTIGDGKRDAVRAFLAARRAAPADCHAYGDDISDAAMLGVVGHPTAVGRDTSLVALARDRGWAVIED